MTKKEFADGVSVVRLAFDLDEVRKSVLSVWYGFGVEEIAAGEWSAIVRKLILHEDRFPQNFVKAVLSYRGPKPNHQKIEMPPDMTEQDAAENRRHIAELMASIGGAM